MAVTYEVPDCGSAVLSLTLTWAGCSEVLIAFGETSQAVASGGVSSSSPVWLSELGRPSEASSVLEIERMLPTLTA